MASSGSPKTRQARKLARQPKRSCSTAASKGESIGATDIAVLT